MGYSSREFCMILAGALLVVLGPVAIYLPFTNLCSTSGGGPCTNVAGLVPGIAMTAVGAGLLVGVALHAGFRPSARTR